MTEGDREEGGLGPEASSSHGARRRRLLGGLGAGLAGIVPAGVGETWNREPDPAKVGSNGGAVVPSRTVSLAEHGGRPGVPPAMLAAAFGQAFRALAEGGTLLVPAGVYDFGVLDGDAAVLCRNARNIAISAYGAVFRASTRRRAAPNLFYFFNFSNVTIAGAGFHDCGFTPWFDWQGMHCVGLQADRPSAGFRMVDCHAERVVGLLASHNNAATRRCIEDVNVRAEIRDCYYGVGANYIRKGVDIDLSCHNVRRALIAYALQDATIAVRVACTPDWPGSNGLVALASNGASAGDVARVRVRVDATGAGIHSSYVHFYHQGPEPRGAMRDIDATVNLVRVRGAGNLFTFDHEIGTVVRRTSRSWDRVTLHGSVDGPFSGKVVSNPSRSICPGSIYLDANLFAMAGPQQLAAGFVARPP
ncbi:MAG: hypothetical protein ACRYGO_13280 [Janthinobacterium lividum]